MEQFGVMMFFDSELWAKTRSILVPFSCNGHDLEAKKKPTEQNYQTWSNTHLADGPWNKSLNFIFPTKYVTPKKSKV